MRAGKLRHEVTIQKPIVTVALGEPNTSWETFDTAWASIEPLRGREYWEAAKINSEITAKVTLRWRRDVKPQMRLKYGPRVFDIVSIVDRDERNQMLELMVTEKRIT